MLSTGITETPHGMPLPLPMRGSNSTVIERRHASMRRSRISATVSPGLAPNLLRY
jgi:hypothetical protein